MIQNFDQTRKEFQGKCFSANNWDGNPMYVFVRKIVKVTPQFDVWRSKPYMLCETYSNIVYAYANSVRAQINRIWFLDDEYMINARYKRIPKGVFNEMFNKAKEIEDCKNSRGLIISEV